MRLRTLWTGAAVAAVAAGAAAGGARAAEPPAYVANANAVTVLDTGANTAGPCLSLIHI